MWLIYSSQVTQTRICFFKSCASFRRNKRKVLCCRLGWLIRFISHSIISGFTTGSAVIIGLSQIKDFLGYEVSGGSKFIPLARSIIAGWSQVRCLNQNAILKSQVPHDWVHEMTAGLLQRISIIFSMERMIRTFYIRDMSFFRSSSVLTKKYVVEIWNGGFGCSSSGNLSHWVVPFSRFS